MRILAILFVVLMASPLAMYAQEEKTKPSTPDPEPEVSVTDQQVTIDGQIINLTATAGTMHIRNVDNKPVALFGFTYYEKKDAEEHRPIVFAYNGGPGSSSFWLHMGILGPKRIPVNDPVNTPAAPYAVVNNEFSILDVADLVMMDPVGTGLSVPVGDAKYEDFWGVDQDIESISRFITQFLIQNDRMNSPKFLLGESYGTFRNAGVMRQLLSDGIALNGVIMVSAVFDLHSLVFPAGSDLSYIVHFPTYASTAWYHDKVKNKPDDLYAFLDEVREFTRDVYAPALFAGDQLSEEDVDMIAEQMAGYTGLTRDYWKRANLRVRNGEYFAELLREDGKTVGRLDSRFTGINQDLLSQYGHYDPQSTAISPAYITGFLDYLHNDLGVSKDANYMVTAGRRDGFKWDWDHRGNSSWGMQAAVNTGVDMAEAMTRDPNVKVLILNGIFDLATVFYGVEYSIDHMGLSPEIKKNIMMEYYEAGHMMYTHPASMAKFKKDVAGFISGAVNRS